MTIDDIRALLQEPKYDFLRANPHLGDNIILLGLGGSHAYGTNVEGSDVDIRGCALNRREELLGMSSFEQVVERETDTVVYGFNKLMGLLIECNPSALELLGCKRSHYLVLTEPGRQLLEKRKMFLSQEAAESFRGYADGQLRQLKNALARDSFSQQQKEEHIRDALERSLRAFDDKFKSFKNGRIELLTAESAREDLESEVFCNIHIDKFPARDFKTILNALSPVIGNYGKLNHKDQKIDDVHLNKLAMHSVRAYLMALDIFEKEEINTYRGADREFLMSIRDGAFQNADGTYRLEFFEIVSDFEKRLEYAVKNTSLPEKPNLKMIEEFMVSINEAQLLQNICFDDKLLNARLRSCAGTRNSEIGIRNSGLYGQMTN